MILLSQSGFIYIVTLHHLQAFCQQNSSSSLSFISCLSSHVFPPLSFVPCLSSLAFPPPPFTSCLFLPHLSPHFLRQPQHNPCTSSLFTGYRNSVIHSINHFDSIIYIFNSNSSEMCIGFFFHM